VRGLAKAGVRTLVAAAVVLAVGAPTAAYAATNTWADDDGTAESSVHVDASDDWAVKEYTVHDGMITSATSATLEIYGRAAGCGTSGATQQLSTYNARLIATFDPCTRFPTTGFGWASFPVPIGYLNEARLSFGVRDVAAGPTAHYAIDTDGSGGGSFVVDGGMYGWIDGELMWRLVTDGNTPALATPATTDFGMPAPGSSSTRTVTVTSSGTATANVTGVTLSGAQAADYAVTSDGCTGQSLAPGATCAIAVTLTPSAIGTRAATLTVTGTSTRTVALTGQGRSAPPVSTITTGGPVLVRTDPLTGTVTDDLAMGSEFVTFTPTVPGAAEVTVLAGTTCNAARTACTWSVPVLFTQPGRYTVTAHGVDSQGIAESPGPTVTVVLV
jgi:hypothetical protein